MSEKRPSKKQHELLIFIDNFIKSTGYGPSYREIMRALDYKSVSTVAVHVDGLITKGLLQKKDNSARSLEIVSKEHVHPDAEHIKWLRREIKKREQYSDAISVEHASLLTQALTIIQDTPAE